ncbi:hypothetical protein P618_200192 [Holospora obtusa F1]|uniref:Uncharacterized protein n=1 Tax=Holospora obtusa F1 TaxID=1399147 RepID=W6TF56_HOLOB|nr:hypothetical protein [Holospora obtusa]ETZ07609.1 hypothetical protein P618_200192 [Holospora obtusa F1]
MLKLENFNQLPTTGIFFALSALAVLGNTSIAAPQETPRFADNSAPQSAKKTIQQNIEENPIFQKYLKERQEEMEKIKKKLEKMHKLAKENAQKGGKNNVF